MRALEFATWSFKETSGLNGIESCSCGRQDKEGQA